ncbi:MAG TPA: hypothetical protein VK548_20830, partial [Candidatus Acidoferrum sp.]|nr:hypothetical protein [Candidatus Acidoferrum sp.]
MSLDGLGLQDLDDLRALMPRSARRLAGGRVRRLDAGPLTSAAAIWGEILTGAPWHENGCAAHAGPWKTLNRVRILTERELAVPVKLIGGESRQLVVNVPLLVPEEPTRLWLADGSLPLATTVSPPALAADELFRAYRPRPYRAIAQALGHRERAILDGIETERQRLHCARALLAAYRPEASIIRLSLFDQLSHVLGPGFLRDEDLRYTKDLRRFLGELDGWIDELFGQVRHVALVSAFSHVPCESRLSLNALLEAGGFLTFAPPDVTAARRVAAMAAVTTPGPSSAPVGAAARYAHPRFQQPIVEPGRTVAASPVLGCVFINARDTFDDGTVEPADVAATRGRLRAMLADALGRRHLTFSIWTGDSRDRPTSGTPGAPRPDLL